MRTRRINLLLIISFILFTITCKKDPLSNFIELDINKGWFPEMPVNITDLNTSFDDYNSDLKGEAQRIKLYYSNNYEKKGKDFDISGAVFDIYIPGEKNGMSFQIANDEPEFAYQLLPLINTEFNEFDPFSFYTEDEVDINTD